MNVDWKFKNIRDAVRGFRDRCGNKARKRVAPHPDTAPKLAIAGWSADFLIGRGGTSSVLSSAGPESGVPTEWNYAPSFVSVPSPCLRSTAKKFSGTLAKILSAEQKETAKSGTFERHQKLTLPKSLYKSGILLSFARQRGGLALPLLRRLRGWQRPRRLND